MKEPKHDDPTAYSVDNMPEDVATELLAALQATIAELEEQITQPDEAAALERLVKLDPGNAPS